MNRLAIHILLAITLATSVASAEESAYNQGVAAWRAKDYAEARKQWEQSLADGGPDEALNNLAFLLYAGLGGLAQPAKAVELWRKGAALAVSEAQLHLGQAYEAGRGVAANAAQAYAWYQCAIATAARNSATEPIEEDILKDANKAMADLAPRLSAADRSAGDAMAKELIAKYATRLKVEQP
jgi:TPR repeat protein